MELESPQNEQKNASFKINLDNKLFKLDFSIVSENLEITIKNESSLSTSYKISFKTEDFHKLNRFFRQFDTVLEIFDFITNIEKFEEKINIKLEDKFAKLKLSIPSVSKIKGNIEIELMIPEIKLKESDLIIKLCEKVEKIDLLEKKINLILDFLHINEKILDFNYYENLKKNNNLDSSIITNIDFLTVSIGIKEKLKKTIKSAKLLYRASRDGDQTQFHSKCGGKENTVTFVKAINGKRFGGFANKPFNSSDSWITDPNAFVFSLDFNECYYYNNNGNMIYGASNGPAWGGGFDLYLASGCLNNNNSETNQSSYNYNGRSNALSGGSNFQAVDYETYELILE